MSAIFEQALGQLLALAAFFGFPVVQYLVLRRIARQEAQPELWYLPAYGYRLVIRNLPREKTLTDIRYRALVRKVVRPGAGSSVATLQDHLLVERSDFFLFPGTDQLLVAFQLIRSTPEDPLTLAKVDKLGSTEAAITLDHGDRLICDYSTMIQNFFNFDVAVARRVEISGESLMAMASAVEKRDTERSFPLDRVRNVG